MSKIYVIFQDAGSDDSWMVKGFTSIEKAEERIAVFQDQDARYNEVILQLYDAFRAWKMENKPPLPEALQPYPKGVSSKEYARVQRENDSTQARNRAAQRAWDERARQFCEGLLEQHLPEADRARVEIPFWSGSRRSYDYTIEELKVE